MRAPSRSDSCRSPPRRRSRNDLVAFLVFVRQGLRLGVRNGVDCVGKIAHAVAIDCEAELHFGPDLVAFGHGNLAHVVAETAELRALPIVPRARRAHPGTDPVLDFRVRPMADDDFAVQAHARMQEPRLAVAMRGLVEVHEVHVDRRPGQVAIELRVQVQERLFQRIEAADPHFGRREGVHPEDQAGAILVRIRLHAELRDFVGRGQERLEHDFERQFRRVRQAARHSVSVGRHLLQRSRPVEMLRAANKPDFGSG